MKIVSVTRAKSQLSSLINAALEGEEVVITRRSVPVVHLKPVEKQKIRFGLLKDLLSGPIPDFLEPMPEEEIKLWERGDTSG